MRDPWPPWFDNQPFPWPSTPTAILNITFQACAGDDRDIWVWQTVRRHSGMVIGGGTFFPSSNRDLQAELPHDRWRACKRELEGRGYKVELRQ